MTWPAVVQACDATKSRALVARAISLAPDRSGVQFSVIERCRRMAAAMVQAWKKAQEIGVGNLIFVDLIMVILLSKLFQVC